MADLLDFPRVYSAFHQPMAVEHLSYPLTVDELKTYKDKGFVIIRGALDEATIEALNEECDRLIGEADMSGKNLRYTDSIKDNPVVPWKIDPCVDVSPLFYRLSRDRRICDRLCSIYGGYNPRLFKDKMIIKPAHSHGNGLHQDYNWWQGFPGSLLSVTIPLNRTTLANGCTQFFTGYEKGFMHVPGEQVMMPEEAVAGEEQVFAELNPGDIGIFGCLTPHAAGPNTTDADRRAMFLSYNDSRDGEHRTSHYEHFFAYRTAGMSLEERRELFW